MKIIKQIFYILFFYVLGESVAIGIRLLVPGLFIPGTLLGMLFLFVALFTRFIKPESLDDIGSFLTSNMSFFFIPASISILDYLDLLEASLFRIIILITITLLLSYFAIAYSIRLTLWIQTKMRGGKKNG